MGSMSLKPVDIAVVGMSGIFPGAGNVEQFSANVMAKKSAVIQVPDDRWGGCREMMVDQGSGTPGPDLARSPFAGLITTALFDPLTPFLSDAHPIKPEFPGHGLDNDFFVDLDPVHHLVLKAGGRLMANARLSREVRRRTGVILAAIALPTPGATDLTRHLFLDANPMMLTGPKAFGASMLSFPAALAARVWGLEGGSFTLDAACASSLFSIKLACEQLQLGRSDAMVAGGVSRPESLYTQVGFTQLQALSSSGRCAPFDRDADGLVVGEGAGLVLLKRLDDALAAGDTIRAVIKGWGVSNDIEGNLVAPASDGQIRAMSAAYKMAGWSVGDIQYMECHGSGTPKGDQVEAQTICNMLERHHCKGAGFSIGSVKSNIGHLLTAAGAAGFIKTIMAMEDEMLPPSLNFSCLPDDSPLNGTGVHVQETPEPWRPGENNGLRRAAVSAFGFGGINAHLLVEGFVPDACRYPVSAAPVRIAPTIPCAIVGMGMVSGAGDTLADFADLLQEQKKLESRPGHSRWRRADHLPPELLNAQSLFMEDVGIDLKNFNIPPNQLSRILPQHLVMLNAARTALEDAGISPKPTALDPCRENMGCAVGIEFDFGATDHHLRWQIKNHKQSVPAELLEQIGPALDFDTTLGALGGIVASRLARAFKLGGPCFTLSADAASGFTAVDVAIKSLSARETDLFLCAAVDLAGDIRSFTRNMALSGLDPGTLPSEGAAALVLKPLDAALRDQDRIYAVVNGVGRAGGAPLASEDNGRQLRPAADAVKRSLQQALESAGVHFSDISFGAVTHSSSHFLGAGELAGFGHTGSEDPSVPVFCPGSLIGHTGASAGLFTLATAALCLYTGYNPCPLSQSADAPQTVMAGCLTRDGAAAHAVLTACPETSGRKTGKESLGSHLSSNLQKNATNKDSGTVVRIPVTRPVIPESLLYARKITDTNNSIQVGSDDVTLMSLADPPEIPSQVISDSVTALFVETQAATARAHEQFLTFSSRNTRAMAEQLAAIANAGPLTGHGMAPFQPDPVISKAPAQDVMPAEAPRVFMDRDQCREFAVGKAGNVLGDDFKIIDTYPVRVRLPDDPLMLVDRIISVEGEKLSLTRGKVVTQHDVHENAWYLDGGKTPVSISIEAGQADLFLCSWLGIDHVVKGKRKYRLLDARVTFHRTLPDPGETIEYHIEIDRFLRQGEIYLFFFHYKGYIDQLPFISMRDGCAGFFTEAEVENSGGIILKKEDKEQSPAEQRPLWIAPVKRISCTDQQVDALRNGDLETAFGPDFKGKRTGRDQWLPGERMRLIHRVLDLDPEGGRFGLGRIVAEADIHPDDWFLTCHFIDDMVMPGTLMYECCAHALRVFVQRMGWILPDDDVHYDVLADNESDLKCRGPVTRDTQKARYDIEIKTMGFDPVPFVTADAHMFSDDLEIVLYKDMGMKLSGASRECLEEYWRKR